MLSTEACVTLTLGLILSPLDYANAILTGLPNLNLQKMQRVQNMTAKLVLRAKKLASPNQCLMQLHWLSIEARIKHKILALVWKYLNVMAPMYLQNLPTLNPCYRPGLQSENSPKKLIVPFMRRKTYADRSFSVTNLREWNNLPGNIQRIDNLDSFKHKLKTHLFKSYFYILLNLIKHHLTQWF